MSHLPNTSYACHICTVNFNFEKTPPTERVIRDSQGFYKTGTSQPSVTISKNLLNAQNFGQLFEKLVIKIRVSVYKTII